MHQIVTKTKHYPLSCEWEIDEFSLRANSDGQFASPEFSVDGLPDVKWHLIVFPNGIREPHDHLSAYIKIQSSTKSIYLMGKFLVKGTSLKKRVRHTFTKTSQTHGSKCLIPLNELYDSYVHDGKLTIQLQATIALNKTSTTCLLGNNDAKDIALIVGDESFHAHSKVLGYHSPVFDRMFNSNFDESIERKVTITDFEFDVVRAAVCFCYDMYSPFIQASEYPYEQLLRFADKYNMQKLMDFSEKSLISKIDISNVCLLIQLSNAVNAFALNEKCRSFISAHIDSTALFHDFENLDSSIVKEIMINIVTPKNQ
uniref:BTB domain-containing protein n=1 Tax=Panagrolaimus sp. PS1159 TaxID=55785 RepID=A0AC35F510_9BILA